MPSDSLQRRDVLFEPDTKVIVSGPNRGELPDDVADGWG